MTKDKKEKKKKKSKIKLPKFKFGSRFGLATNIHRDWKIILIGMVSLAVLASVLSAYMFYKIEKGTLFRDIEIEETVARSLNVGDLQRTALEIETLQDRFEETLSNVPDTYDPAQ